MKVSFLIPSFNGLELLKKHLPAVLSAAKDGDEIVIVEDAGNDDTVAYYREKYDLKLHEQTPQYNWWRARHENIVFNLIYLTQNQRFARACNIGARLASGDLIFLLNNDVAPQPNSREQLAKYFAKENNIFAVTAREIEPSTQKISGKNSLYFARGRFWHRGENSETSGDTAWASGGSSMFSRAKWLAIGGFDDRYYPAYWEDIDFSFEAKKRGWQVLFDREAVVEHHHETTNNSVFGQKKIAQMSFTNGTRFTWKNSNFWQKLQFLLFAPYWYFKNEPGKLLWLAVILVAAILQLVALFTFPRGLTVDEAAIGYSGIAIARAGQDEWLNDYPISFQSFGDYKAPLAIYLAALQFKLMPLTLITLRLPFLAASLLTILAVMKLAALIAKDEKYAISLSSLVGIATVFSPWWWHFSHLALEANYALCFVSFGLYFLLKHLLEARNWRGVLWEKKWWSGRVFLGGIFLSLSLYAYHSSKIFVPLLALTLLITFSKTILSRAKLFITAFIPSLLILIPLARDALFAAGATRAKSLFIFDSAFSLGERITLTFQNLTSYFSPSFLLFGQTSTVIAGNGHDGVLNLIWLIIILFSFYVFSKTSRGQKPPLIKWFFLGLILTIFGFLPASFGSDTPHLIRSYLALPGLIILFTLGLISLATLLKKHQLEKTTHSWYMVIFLLLFFIFLNFFSHYQNNYHRQVGFSRAFNEGLYDAFLISQTHEPTVSKIMLTTTYEHPYITALFVRRTHPLGYQGGSLSAKYDFVDSLNAGDFDRPNVLLISHQKIDGPSYDNVLWQQEIVGKDGQTKFYLYRTK